MFENTNIPKNLIPRDGRFGSGPSLVRPDSMQSLVEVQKDFLGTSHRKPAIKDCVSRVFEKMRSYLDIPADYKIAMGNGGATLTWDMCTFALVEKKAAHFTNGEFSQKWFKSTKAAPFVEAEQIDADLGSVPEFKSIDGADVHCITWNETSTGAMWPSVPNCEGSLLAVDATSAAGALKWDLAKTDLFYFSPQKAFGAEGGLWIGFFSPKCVEQIERVQKSSRHIPTILDFTTALTNGESNQTYNTPSLTTLYLLDKQLDWFVSRGLNTLDKEQRAKAALLDAWVEARPELSHYVTNPEFRSKTVSTINIVDEISYTDLAKCLRRHGILDIECYRKLGKNQVRISLFPNILKADLEKLTKCIDYLFDNR